MKLLGTLLAGAALGIVFVAFRDFDNGTWLSPAGVGGGSRIRRNEEEPVLGYDGMEEETLLYWLADAHLDRTTLLRMRRYEADHRAREAVLDAIGADL